MKVKCNKVIGDVEGEDCGEKNFWRTRGKEYVVLGIAISKSGMDVRILDDEGHSPYLCQMIGLEVTSQKMPENWGFWLHPDGDYIAIMPKSWLAYDDFWGSVYDDDDLEAIKLLYEEAEAMYREEGMPIPWLEEEK